MGNEHGAEGYYAEIENGVPVPGVGEQDWLLDTKVGGYAAQLERYWPQSLDDTSPFGQELLVIHPEQEVEGTLERDGQRQ